MMAPVGVGNIGNADGAFDRPTRASGDAEASAEADAEAAAFAEDLKRIP